MHGLETEGTRSLDIRKAVIKEKSLFGLYAKLLDCVLEYRGIGLGAVRLEGCHHAVEVVFAAETFLTEFVSDDTAPHHGVGIAQQVYAEATAAQVAESLETVSGNTYDKLLEGSVNLIIGDSGGQLFMQGRVEFVDIYGTVLYSHKDSCLSIVPEVRFGILETKGFESINATLTLYIYDYTAKVEQQITYHLDMRIV